jgi:hypothetical protein
MTLVGGVTGDGGLVRHWFVKVVGEGMASARHAEVDVGDKLVRMATHLRQRLRPRELGEQGCSPRSAGTRGCPRGATRMFALATAVAVGVGVAGCSSGGDAVPAGTASVASAGTEPARATQTSTPPTSNADQVAAAAWKTVWAAATLTPESEVAARVVAVPAVVDRVKALSGGARTATVAPTVSARSEGGLAIEDCVVLVPRLGEQPTVGFTGTFQDGHITELQPRDGRLQPCVPKQIGDASIQGYQDYWSKRSQYSDPADPLSPLIAETTTGKRRDNLVQQLQADQQRNQALRGMPETHPEVIEVRSSTEVVVLDCQLQDPSWGVYDRGTGALTGERPIVTPNRRDVWSAVMRLEDGRWKVEDLQGREGVSCEFAPTSQGLPSF